MPYKNIPALSYGRIFVVLCSFSLLFALIAGLSSITPNAEGAITNPVAHWNFNSNLSDTSANGNNGVAKGGAQLVNSDMGKALSLDGSGDYVRVEDSSSLRLTGAFTLSAWIKLDTLSPDGDYTRILEKGSSPGDKYWMFYHKGSKKIGFGFISSGNDVQLYTLKTNWQTGKWYHVVGTYDPATAPTGSSNMKIYVDGVLNNQATKTGRPLSDTKPLLIGTKSSTGWDFWKGDLDEVSVYNRALTASDVKSLYDSASLVVYTFCSSGCDYNNLQTAINSLPFGGGKIFIKDGNYEMSNSIILKSDTKLEFSAQASINFRGSSKPIFKGTGVSDVVIKGGTITAEFSGVKAIAFLDSNWITVDGTKMQMVKGGDSNAFYCVDCTNVYVSNINAKGATRLVDIKTDSRTNDGLSRNIWIRNGVFDDTSEIGIKVNYSTDVHIMNNRISNAYDNGIDIGWNKNSEVSYNILTNTGLSGSAAIHTDSANGADIIGNNIATTGHTAITVYRASNIDVVGNTITNAGGAGVSVITLAEPSSYIKVNSNHIIAPGSDGIYVSPGQSNVEISYNTLEDIPSGYKAISVGSGNPTTTVFGNEII